MPSVVTLDPLGCHWVGQAALHHAADPDVVCIHSIKRSMGQDRSTHIQVFGKSWSPEEISAEILRALKSRAESILGQPVKQAVITVPAYFDDAARTATKHAAQLAGLHVLRLLNEPTAAAVAYGLEKGVEGLYAIYDLGGGTFDLSILNLQAGVFQVLATAGDTHLGGDDFDDALLTLIIQQQQEMSQTPFDVLRTALRPHIRQWKSLLSTEVTCSYTFSWEGYDYQGDITRNDFEQAIAPLIQRTLAVCAEVMHNAALSTQAIHGVVLIGGSTRVPAVVSAVKTFFQQEPLNNIDPDTAVALGAGIQAYALTHGSDTLLLDVTPISLGLETMGGLMEKIIPRNTPIPAMQQQDFTTFQDNQTAMQIHVVQGEREFSKDCRSLAYFELKGIPPMGAGQARIQVTFAVDADGLLSVTARETTTGLSQYIEVQCSYGLTEEEMLHLLKEGVRHAQEDMIQRALTEAKIEGQRLIQAVTHALKQDEALLQCDEKESLLHHMCHLEEALKAEKCEEIKEAISALEQASADFAERRVSQVLKQVL